MPVNLTATTIDDLLRAALEALRSEGSTIDPSRGSAVELIGVCLELTNPRARLSKTESRRKLISAVAEFCWYLTGVDEAKAIEFYIPKYAAEAEADGTIHGAYGPRLFGETNQVRNVIDLLSTSPESRRAVIQLFDRTDIGQEPRFKDIPCTCTLQFLIRDGRLHLVTYMRSNDAHLGLPHDIFSFTMLQELVARSLTVDLGSYYHMVGSLHYYKKDADAVAGFLSEGWQSTLDPMPPMPTGDPWTSVEQLVVADAQVRALTAYQDIGLPEQAYWADLVRLLADWSVRNKAHRPEEANLIRADIVHLGYLEFLPDVS